MGSRLPALAATTNQPFGMHFRHVHVPASSPYLPSLLGSRFLLIPKEKFDFDLGLCKKVPFVQCRLTTLLALMHDTISWKFLAFISLCNLMWYICVTLCPPKRKVMSSSRSTSLLSFCRSSMEFFYGFLGMFHVGFIHPRCLYWMVYFPLD